MPNYNDFYEDEDGNTWQFDPPYDDDLFSVDDYNYGPDWDRQFDTREEAEGLR